ncbi:MAG: glycosyltransferase family 87 protein [Candidatus Dormibacteria bacterium]
MADHGPPDRTRPGVGLLLPVVSGSLLAIALAVSRRGLFNDFYDYWAAARLIGAGHSPYDLTAIQEVQHSAGITALAGGGYSYPILFSELIRPLGALEPQLAATLFTVISILSLAALGRLLTWGMLRGLPATEAWWPLALAGTLGPVVGSLYFGQVNPWLLPLMALALEERWAGPLLALSAAVKLYPVAGFAGFGFRWRRAWWEALSGVLLLLLLVLGPSLLGAPALPAGQLLLPDPFWTNQSLNGALSRLFMPSDWTRPLLAGLPVIPVEVALGIAAAALLALLLWRTRAGPLRGPTLTALLLGTLLAPKNSYWNLAPLAIGLVYVLSRRPRSARMVALTVAGATLLDLQALFNLGRDWLYRELPMGALWSSVGFMGGVLLLIAVALSALGEGSDLASRQRLVHDQ